MTDAPKQAIQYLIAVCDDYASTLPPSVRGPFTRECQAAIKTLMGELQSSATQVISQTAEVKPA